MNYVKNVSNGLPYWRNNIKTSKGRKVGVFVVVMYDNLRKHLEEQGIIKKTQ